RKCRGECPCRASSSSEQPAEEAETERFLLLCADSTRSDGIRGYEMTTSPRLDAATRSGRHHRDLAIQRLRVARGVVLPLERAIPLAVVKRVELGLAQERRRIEHLDAAELEALLVHYLRVVVRRFVFGPPHLEIAAEIEVELVRLDRIERRLPRRDD